MSEVDRAMIEDYRIDLVQMMENAGRNLAHLARKRFFEGDPRGRTVIVLAGTGGNGGGALVCARRLHNYGARVQVFVTKPDSDFTPIPAHQLDILRRMQVPVAQAEAVSHTASPDLIVDGVIGYSLNGDPRNSAGDLIRWANGQAAPILALDAPSGVDTTTGTVFTPAIKATATMTLAFRLLRGGHRVVVYDLNEAAIQAAEAAGAVGARTLSEMAGKLATPRAVWVVVPAGDPTEQTINQLAEALSPGDIIIDGGNSNYKDSMRRGAALQESGLHFVDVGTSGGVWGLAEGYSMMVGGDEQVVKYLTPLLETLGPAVDKGWGRVGPVGSGHFVKMVHNGIEYGLMQAYAEGLELMQHKTEFRLDLPQITEIWRTGSVVRSWLLDLTANALAENPTLEGIAAYVSDY
jgi:6-phosphogluconate dehydrogenase